MKTLTDILVISEDAHFLEKLPEIFPNTHYVVCGCYSEALELIASGFLPEFLLVDLVLPEKTGAETLDELQKILLPREVPGVMITNNDHLVLYSMPRPPELLGIISKKGDDAFIYERIKKLWDDYQAELVDGSILLEQAQTQDE